MTESTSGRSPWARSCSPRSIRSRLLVAIVISDIVTTVVQRQLIRPASGGTDDFLLLRHKLDVRPRGAKIVKQQRGLRPPLLLRDRVEQVGQLPHIVQVDRLNPP